MARLDKILQRVRDDAGSDLHLASGCPPAIRVHGDVEPIAGHPPMDDEDLADQLAELAGPTRWANFTSCGDLDFAYRLEGVGRFRANYFYRHEGVAAVFRIIPEKIMSIEQLNLPPVIATLADLTEGLVLVTGPTGSGKSTTLASIINAINTRYPRHIVTIEDPVEFVHPNQRSVITQREVGSDTLSFSAALKAALRQDAEVILVGELRDLETIALALEAASMGVLVFATLHTSSASKTIDRLIDVFPSDEQGQARGMLADSLAAVVAQLLLRKKTGGRVATQEILIRTSGLGGVIREGNTSMINSIIGSGKRVGMQLMDDVLYALIEKDVIEGREGYLKAHDKNRFRRFAEA